MEKQKLPYPTGMIYEKNYKMEVGKVWDSSICFVDGFYMYGDLILMKR